MCSKKPRIRINRFLGTYDPLPRLNDIKNEYLKTKEGLKDGDKEKFHAAKKEWQSSWNKFLETLAYLETLEI